MNVKRTILAAALMTLAGSAAARTVDVSALAEQTGLTERQVRMVLGAPSSYAEYRTSYFIAEQRVMAALGTGDYYYDKHADAAVIDDDEPAVETTTTTTTRYEDDDYGDESEPLDEPARESQLELQDVDDDD